MMMMIIIIIIIIITFQSVCLSSKLRQNTDHPLHYPSPFRSPFVGSSDEIPIVLFTTPLP